jgi:chromosome segregation ATPase
VADGGTGQAVKKYGTITPSGDRVIPPVVEPVDTEPAECGQLRAQISSLMDMIRVLEERKRRLDPKNELDRARIEGINDEISELDVQLSPLRQRLTAIDCWV